jgi:Methyltransferase domain
MRAELDPDPAWVAALTGRTPGACAAAIEEAASERQLFAHLRRRHEEGGRDSYVEIDAPLELYAIVRLLKPRHVVEVGVSSGVSSAYLLKGLEQNGRGTLHSVDRPAFSRARPGTAGPRMSWSLPAGATPGWAVPAALRARWDLRWGDKARVLPLLADELPAIDIVVYDVPHEEAAAWSEFTLLGPRISPGGVAVVDHGPAGGLCEALRRWAHDWATPPARRTGLGLFGASRPRVHRSR